MTGRPSGSARWAILLGFGFAGAGGPAGAQVCGTDDPATAGIREVAAGIVEADNRLDIEAVLDHYRADAVLMPPGEPPVVGRDRIRPRYQSLFEAFTPEIEPEIVEACAESNSGFVRGHNGGRLVSRKTGEVRLLDDAYLMLLRRDGDGVWRISHLIWHRQSAPASAARE